MSRISVLFVLPVARVFFMVFVVLFQLVTIDKTNFSVETTIVTEAIAAKVPEKSEFGK